MFGWESRQRSSSSIVKDSQDLVPLPQTFYEGMIRFSHTLHFCRSAQSRSHRTHARPPSRYIHVVYDNERCIRNGRRRNTYLLFKFVQVCTGLQRNQQVQATLTICSSSSYVRTTLFDNSNTPSLTFSNSRTKLAVCI